MGSAVFMKGAAAAGGLSAAAGRSLEQVADIMGYFSHGTEGAVAAGIVGTAIGLFLLATAVLAD